MITALIIGLAALAAYRHRYGWCALFVVLSLCTLSGCVPPRDHHVRCVAADGMVVIDRDDVFTYVYQGQTSVYDSHGLILQTTVPCTVIR